MRVSLSLRPEWLYVTPVPQDDEPSPAVPMSYKEEYFRIVSSETMAAANLLTACTPYLFRQISTEYRFCRKITLANWSVMELCPQLQELAYLEGLNQFTIKSKGQAWYISYADGRLQGSNWEFFVIAHNFRETDTLVFCMDVDLNLIAMVFDQNGCERTFYWYTNIEDDATSFNQEVQ